MSQQLVMDMTERHLPAYRDLGRDYVAVYRHMDHPDLAFAESYERWEDYNRARKYWMANDYIVRKLWDLDYIDYIKEQSV